MARKTNNFPLVPVLMVGGALAGLLYLGTRKKTPAPVDRQNVPVGTPPNGGGPGTRIRTGNRFTADLSSSLASSTPAVRMPGAVFIAQEDYTGAGLGQNQGLTSITSRHEATGEIVPVPVKFITAIIG